MGCFILHPMSLTLAPLENPSRPSSPPTKFASASKPSSGVAYRKPQFHTHRWLCAPNPQPRPLRLAASADGPSDEEETEEAPVQELRVPEAWLTRSNALQERSYDEMLLGSPKLAPANRSLEVHYIQSPNIKKFRLHGRVGPDTVIKGGSQHFIWKESEWLRVTLHKWLDDEYCPEAANVEISKVAARSYYESLMEQQSDLGEILLKMAKDLETVSFKKASMEPSRRRMLPYT